MIINGDAFSVLPTLDAQSVQTCITSPPYFQLRDYQAGDFEIGNEPEPEDYVANLVDVFRAVKHVLKPDGTLWLNLGDTMQRGAMLGIPWRVAFALMNDGWVLRNDIIWAKPNPMPESVKNRLTRSHEHLFLFALKSSKYKFNQLKETAACAGQMRGGSKNRYEQNESGMDAKVYDTRNMRDVWTVRPASLSGAHFAIFPDELIEPCVLAGSDEGDTILDPFSGSATVGVVARRHGRDFIGVELNGDYAELGRQRVAGTFKRKWPTDLQTWHSIYKEIGDVLAEENKAARPAADSETPLFDHEPTDEQIREFHRCLMDELHRRRSEVYEYNDAISTIAQRFTPNVNRWLREILNIEDPDYINGFDTAVDFATACQIGEFAQLLRSNDPEGDLFDALKGGFKPLPTLADDSIWQTVLNRVYS